MEETKTAVKLQKYLIFSLGSEYYGISILKVREIIRHEIITPVHDTFSYMDGIVEASEKLVMILNIDRITTADAGVEMSDITV